jgi:hypothetical protein
LLGDSILVDGGVASNLPAFLFAEEHLNSRIPTLAFDLRTPGPAEETGFVQFGRQLMSTSLEASDHLLRQGTRGVYHVPVDLPVGVSTFSLGLGDNEAEALYNAGYASSSQTLAQLDQLQWARLAGGDLRKQLQAVYGDQKLFQPTLYSIASFVEDHWDSQNVRCSVMVPTGRATRMVIYEHGMSQDPDVDLELAEAGGCTGRAFTTGLPVYADLQAAQIDFDTWNMTPEQQAKVKPTQLAMVAVPIRASGTPGKSKKDLPVIATLGIDSSTALADTGWVYDDGSGLRVDPKLESFLEVWSDIVGRVMG